MRLWTLNSIEYCHHKLLRGIHLPQPLHAFLSWLTGAWMMCAVWVTKLAAEDQVDWKHEFYEETRDRVSVETSSVLVEKSLGSRSTLRGQVVYDSISGASPTGGPPRPGSEEVPVASVRDIRRAGNLEFSQRLGNHTLTPKVAYSTENDYESIGMALAESFEFNQKNSTLHLAVSRDFDRLLNANTPYVGIEKIQDKETTDFLVGFSQLLSPKTILTANLTLGFARGYLTDPYKGIQFQAAVPFFGNAYLFGEKRPDSRDRQVLHLGLTHFLKKANASMDLGYRFHHDTFGIEAHTVSAAWHQKLGEKVSLQPLLRYHRQSAADFYYPTVPNALGFPLFPTPQLPSYYSADYRISALHSWTMGLGLTVRAHEKVWLEGAYKRYEMWGDDGITAAAHYPKANVWTLGMVIWF